jgi:RNA polymerase sigma factor (sigma-70 family)
VRLLTRGASYARRVGSAGFFPSTRQSALLGALSEDGELRRRSWERLGRAYERAIYKHLRAHWRLSPEDAADATQAFFELCLEGAVLERYDRERARFRTYLRLRLDRFVQDERRARMAQRRGGHTRTMDLEAIERELSAQAVESDPEAAFDREWTRTVLALALDGLRELTREKHKEEHFRAFERFHVSIDEPAYADVAKELGIDEVTLTHRLAYARRHYRRLVLETLRELTASDDEYREEAKVVLGVDV